MMFPASPSWSRNMLNYHHWNAYGFGLEKRSSLWHLSKKLITTFLFLIIKADIAIILTHFHAIAGRLLNCSSNWIHFASVIFTHQILFRSVLLLFTKKSRFLYVMWTKSIPATVHKLVIHAVSTGHGTTWSIQSNFLNIKAVSNS